ncbi:MAG: response regulator transcription factor [Caldilineaceae bacterium]
MKILIVDDHILFREGVASLLHMQHDIEVIGQAGTVQEAVALATELRPDLILMDFGLSDGTGLEATQQILAVLPHIKIVFLTVHEDDDRLFRNSVGRQRVFAQKCAGHGALSLSAGC